MTGSFERRPDCGERRGGFQHFGPIALLLAAATATQACAGSGSFDGYGPSRASGQSIQVDAGSHGSRTGMLPSGWLASLPSGAVVLASGQDREVVLPDWSLRESLDLYDPGARPGAPVIDYDPETGHLWYSDAHASIRSVDLATGASGRDFASFSDTAIRGCGVTANGRLFTVDPARRLLYAPMLTGQVLAYDLDNGDVRGSLEAGVFGDMALGRYRALAVDPGGMLWALDERGSAKEIDPERRVATGRAVAAAARELSIDAGRGLLILHEAEGLRAVSLDDLQPATLDLPLAAERAEFVRAVIATPGSPGSSPAEKRVTW